MITVIDERYEILSEIGRGGFGTVYKARQTQLDRTVAIKVLKTDVLQEHDGLARFEREARTLSALKHKNIVGCYGFGVWRQAPYMVLELAEGIPLGELGQIDAVRAVALTKQIFEGLACAHASGVVHRDMKPSNVLVLNVGTAGELVKIIDFGLVKLMPGYGVPGQKLTETGYALGTCHYMAPEQALGGSVDQRADIYSAGCILYELVAGRRPFEADDNVAIMFKHLNDQPPPIDEMSAPDAGYAAALGRIIGNCLLKDPNKRYQNCAEVLADLNALQKGASDNVAPLVMALKSSTGTPAGSHRALHRLMISLALAAGAAATLAIAWMLNKNTTSQPAIRSSVDVWHEIERIPYEQRWPAGDRRNPAVIKLLDEALALDKKDHALPKMTRLNVAQEAAQNYCDPTLSAAQKEAVRDKTDYYLSLIKSGLGTAEARSLHISTKSYISLLHDWKDTKTALAEAARYAPTEYVPTCSRQIALQYLLDENRKKAREVLRPALRVKPSELRSEERPALLHCWSILAAFDMADGKTQQSVDLYRKIVNEQIAGPALAHAYCALADVALRDHNFKKSLQYSKLAVARETYTEAELGHYSRFPFSAYMIQLASLAALNRTTEYNIAKASFLNNLDMSAGNEIFEVTASQNTDAINILREKGRVGDWVEIEAAMRQKMKLPEHSETK